MPPFKAALDAGVNTFTNSSNDLNGVPATGNAYLQRDILKGMWNFNGIILMKNENNILLLNENAKTIAFIGPLVKEHKQNLGFWSIELDNVDYDQFVVSQWEGVKNRLGDKANLLYAKGCERRFLAK